MRLHDRPSIVNLERANATDMFTFKGLDVQYNVAPGQIHQSSIQHQLRFLVMTDHDRFSRLYGQLDRTNFFQRILQSGAPSVCPGIMRMVLEQGLHFLERCRLDLRNAPGCHVENRSNLVDVQLFHVIKLKDKHFPFR